MALIAEITDIIIRESGEKFKGQMHNISAKLILKEGATVIHEQTFSEKHKNIYNIADTMEKIRIAMSATKKKIEVESTIKTEAELEIPGMLTKIAAEGK